MADLVSIDVFDTLLTRAVGAPTSVFLLLGRQPAVRRLTGATPEQFARLRIEAERRARRDLSDVTLQQIHHELAAGLALDAQQAKELLEAELALERRLSRVVPGVTDVLARAEAPRRVAISDMYLPVGFVEELLERAGLAHTLDHVYVSSDLGGMKRTGALFRQVAAAERVPTSRWQHVGDDPRSDDRVPRLLGIATTPVTRARLNRYEHLWDDYRWETGGLTSLFAGASRLARLGTDAPAELEPIVRVAAGVAAPVLTAYVLWVLNSARREGLERLYFLARDGEILFEIARRLCERLGLAIDVRYLHGSRFAFHRATVADTGLGDADWLWQEAPRLSDDAVLRWLGLTEQDVRNVLQRHGLTEGRRTAELRARLAGDAEFGALVGHAAVGAREATLRYLSEQGLADGTPFAVVDTGWEGRLLQSLHELLEPLGSGLHRAFFLGYLNRGRGFHRPDAITGYLFDEHRGTGVLDLPREIRWLIEAFCVADHGTTTTFAGTPAEPVLADEHNPVLRHWPAWQVFRRTVEDFVETCVWDADLAHIEADLRRPAAEVLTRFWTAPSRDEAAAWGAFPSERDPLATSTRRLATPVRMRDLARGLDTPAGSRDWMPGSLALSSPVVRPVAAAAIRAAQAVRRERRVDVPRHWRERAAVARLAWQMRRGRDGGSPS